MGIVRTSKSGAVVSLFFLTIDYGSSLSVWTDEEDEIKLNILIYHIRYKKVLFNACANALIHVTECTATLAESIYFCCL